MRKMILREPVITPKTKMAYQIGTNQNPEPSKYIAGASHCQVFKMEMKVSASSQRKGKGTVLTSQQ